MIVSAGAVVVWTSLAGADTAWNAAPLTADPSVSTPVAVSGAGCVGNNVLIVLSQGANTETLPGVVNTTITPALDGTWSGVLNVPSGLATGPYTLWGQCIVQFNYEAKAFTVATPTPPTPPPAATVLAPAAAVLAPARFTG